MSATEHDGRVRPIALKTKGFRASDGDGVNLRRMIGTPEIDMLDPFLLLDWFHSDQPQDYIGGFPDHPHRGFETVTYLINGRMRHWDNKGHEGVIEPGGIQWMTAAGGIVHSEMPEQEDGLLSGFQLWVNLPAAAKMGPAGYQEFAAGQIPAESRDGVELHLITGRTSEGTAGPVRDIATDPFYADAHMAAHAVLREPLDPGHNVFVMVHDGAVHVPGADRDIAAGELAVLGAGDVIELRAGAAGAKALIIAGRPIGEPVARGGPFVMNTRAEVLQAFEDFRQGRM